jgi:hypothetical protein
MSTNYLEYNGLTFSISNIQSVTSEAVYDASGNNIIYMKNTVMVTGVLSGNSANDYINKARIANQVLRIERKNLRIVVGGIEMYNIVAAGQTAGGANLQVDCNNGPMPQNVKIYEQVGSRFSFIDFTIVFWTTNCTNSDIQILNHKYSVTSEYDADMYLTRTISGKLTFMASDPDATNPINPDSFRDIITPKVPTSMVREKMIFDPGIDGLSLTYQIIDREVYLVYPSITTDEANPIRSTKCEAKHAITLVLDPNTGPTWVHTMSAAIQSTKNTKKIDLYNMLRLIVDKYIGFTSDPTKELVTGFTLAEELFSNSIEMQLSKRLFLGSNSFLPQSNLHFFEDVPGTADNKSVDIGPYGSALLAAAKYKFYNTCVDTAAPAGMTTGSGDSTGPLVVVAPSVASNLDQAGDTNQNTAQSSNPYMAWSEVIDWTEINNLILLPSTTQNAAGLVYQTGIPYIVQKQKGTATRRGLMPELPVKWNVSDASDGYRIKRNITTETPVLAQDGISINYTVHWDVEYYIPWKKQFKATSEGYQQLVTADDAKPNAKSFALPVPIPVSRTIKNYNTGDQPQISWVFDNPTAGGLMLPQDIFPS